MSTVLSIYPVLCYIKDKSSWNTPGKPSEMASLIRIGANKASLIVPIKSLLVKIDQSTRTITSRLDELPPKPKPWPYNEKPYKNRHYFFDKTTTRFDENTKVSNVTVAAHLMCTCLLADCSGGPSGCREIKVGERNSKIFWNALLSRSQFRYGIHQSLWIRLETVRPHVTCLLQKLWCYGFHAEPQPYVGSQVPDSAVSY